MKPFAAPAARSDSDASSASSFSGLKLKRLIEHIVEKRGKEASTKSERSLHRIASFFVKRVALYPRATTEKVTDEVDGAAGGDGGGGGG